MRERDLYWLWMSFRAQEILPVYKIDWHLLFPTMFRHCNLVMKVFNLLAVSVLSALASKELTAIHIILKGI